MRGLSLNLVVLVTLVRSSVHVLRYQASSSITKSFKCCCRLLCLRGMVTATGSGHPRNSSGVRRTSASAESALPGRTASVSAMIFTTKSFRHLQPILER